MRFTGIAGMVDIQRCICHSWVECRRQICGKFNFDSLRSANTSEARASTKRLQGDAANSRSVGSFTPAFSPSPLRFDNLCHGAPLALFGIANFVPK